MRGWRFLLLALSLMTGASAADARWLRAESAQFEVYSQGSERSLRESIQNLEDFDAVLRVTTGAAGRGPAKLVVYLVASRQDLHAVDSARPETTLGFYSASLNGVLAVAVRADGEDDGFPARTVLLHEYTHHFMSAHFPGGFPAWYTEGIAEYFSTARFKRDTVEVGNFAKDRLIALRLHGWTSTRKLFQPAGEDRTDAMFYSEAWLVTQYLMEDPDRRKQLARYLEALRGGADAEAVFRTAFGMDYAAFDKIMGAYLARGEILSDMFRRTEPPKPGDIAVTALSPAADRLLLLRARMEAGAVSSREERQALVAEITRAAAAFPDDPLALHIQAMSEVLHGDAGRADALLDALLAKNSHDVEANYLKARNLELAGRRAEGQRAGLWVKAKVYLDTVNSLNPNHFQALFLCGAIALAEDKMPSQKTLDVLARAHELAPRVHVIAIRLAAALARVNRFEDAKGILEAVIHDPHGSPSAPTARELLESVTAALGKAASGKKASP